MNVAATIQDGREATDEAVLHRVRPLDKLHSDSTGQLAVEWVLVTTFAVIPMLMWIPYIVYDMIPTYFYRTAEVIRLPLP